MAYEGYEAEEILRNMKDVKDIEPYTLIYNYGWTFTKHGKKHDLERIANMYGADLGWSLDGTYELTLLEALVLIAQLN